MNDAFASVYERGYAIGHSDVKTDTIVLNFKDEVFEFPTAVALRVARFNGYFYEAPVDKLRQLEAELSSGS